MTTTTKQIMLTGDSLTHSTSIKVDVYPEEFKPIMKALRYSLSCSDSKELFDDDERFSLEAFLYDFSSTALNEAI